MGDGVLELAKQLSTNTTLKTLHLMVRDRYLCLLFFSLTSSLQDNRVDAAGILRFLEYLKSNQSLEELYFVSSFQLNYGEDDELSPTFSEEQNAFARECLVDNFTLIDCDLPVSIFFVPKAKRY